VEVQNRPPIEVDFMELLAASNIVRRHSYPSHCSCPKQVKARVFRFEKAKVKSHVSRHNPLIILVIILLGGFSGFGGGPFYGTGYYGGGGLGLVIVVILILVLLGRI
jgi:Protein of unknown function (DUF3309)